MAGQRNSGIYKVCDCTARKQPTCKHSFYLAFRYRQGKHWRLSLDKIHGSHIEKLTDAKALADDLRGQIRRGAYPPVVATVAATPATTASAITFTALGALWIEREREGRVADWKSDRSRIATLSAVTLESSTLGARPIGRITADDLEVACHALKSASKASGTITKYLQALLSLQKWAVRKGYLTQSWFDADNRPAKRAKPNRRTRRLEPAVLGPRGQVVQASEEQRLLDAANPWMQRLIIAALETGMRRGELLKLQWRHVDVARGQFRLSADMTKTGEGRTVVLSARLRAVLEMVRTNVVTGQPHAATAFVFGTAEGRAIGNPAKAWETCVLRAHGVTPVWDKTGSNRLSAESRAHLHAIDLHWHDLRHEAGSRWIEAAWPLHHVQRTLGHANLTQTSTYLNATVAGIEESMRKMDAQRGYLQSVAQAPKSAPRPDCNDEQAEAANVLVN